MGNTYYTNERNIQMLIGLMKAHGIRRVVVSPGTTNMSFVASIQYDSFFEMYSSVDERSAAYIACGIAEETGEPVALSCTGATASRNYFSGLTEAYYRKLPILAITTALHAGYLGQNMPQIIDRTAIPNDIVKMSVQIPSFHDETDEWGYNVLLNKALLELKHRGGGPVHINIATTVSLDYSIHDLPEERVIERISYGGKMPEIIDSKIAIFVGAHKKWNNHLTEQVDLFCEKYNAIVICDQTSNYKGKYQALASLLFNQRMYNSVCKEMDVLIHIGDISGAYLNINPKQSWRVNPDGEIRDTFRTLKYVFEMDELAFFEYYNEKKSNHTNQEYWNMWCVENQNIRREIPEIPYSNLWVAKNTISLLPDNSILYLGILNSLRAWNMFELSKSVLCYSNVGGFGIDGGMSSLIGASLINPEKLYFGVVGDLAFFYDINVLGNRHLGNNLRIILINNGKGTEFRNYSHNAAKFGDDADQFVAAAGHFGCQSSCLVKNFVENLGFKYFSAKTKEEYLNVVEEFVTPETTEKSMVLEVFTTSKDESEALKIMDHIWVDPKLEKKSNASTKTKQIIKDFLGEDNIHTIKNLMKSKK